MELTEPEKVQVYETVGYILIKHARIKVQYEIDGTQWGEAELHSYVNELEEDVRHLAPHVQEVILTKVLTMFQGL